MSKLTTGRRGVGRRGLLATLAISGLMANPAHGTNCTVNALTAYLQAAKKGWTFYCTRLSGSGTVVFLPLVPDGLGCVGKVDGFPMFGDATILVSLFINGSASGRSSSLKFGTLKNGWSLVDYDAFGAHYHRYYDDDRALIRFRTDPIPAGTKFKLVVKNLKLTKQGGVCSKAIEEAF